MSPASVATALGFQTSLKALPTRALTITAASAVAFSSLAAFAERKASLTEATSRTLQGATFGLVIPLATFSLVLAATERARFDRLLTPLALIGINRRYASVGAIIALSAVAAFLALVCSTVACLVASRGLSASSLAEIYTCSSVSILSAFAYTSLFCFGSTWGAKGGGRSVVLFIDLLAGASPTMAAIAFPKAHALNFLGATPAIPISQTASLAALGLIGIAACALTSRRLHP